MYSETIRSPQTDRIMTGLMKPSLQVSQVAGAWASDRSVFTSWETSLYGRIPPFIHFAYNRGTFLELLYPSNTYPAEGVRVPTAFGLLDRAGMVAQVGSSIEGAHQHYLSGNCHYYDGASLAPVSLPDALGIISQYRRDTLAAFHARPRSYDKAAPEHSHTW